MLAPVEGWETVLAAVGGLVLGIGLGIVIGRRHAHGYVRRMRRVESRVRASVIPVLEDQAHTLELPHDERAPGVEDPFEVAVDLATAIQRHRDSHDMAFSDTLEVSRKKLEGEL
jgi:hypothetical protein